MTEDAQTRDELLKPRRRPPRIGMYIAVLLEVGMVTVFVAEHSVVGVLLAIAYSWFSATWSLLRSIIIDIDKSFK